MIKIENYFQILKKIILNVNSALIILIISLFVGTYFYIFNFVKESNTENSHLFQFKEKLTELIHEDELLAVYTKSRTGNSQSNFDWEGRFNETLLSHDNILTELKKLNPYPELETSIQGIFESSSKIHDIEKQLFADLRAKKGANLKDNVYLNGLLNENKLKEKEAFTEVKLLLNKKIEDRAKTYQQKLFWGQIYLIFDILFLAFIVFFHLKKVNSTLNALYQIQTEKEEAQEHMTIMGELTSGINHEIKNIICVAGLHSNQLSNQLKRQKPLTTEQILYSVQKIENSVTRAEKIIRSVNKLSFDSKNEDKRDCSIYEVLVETKEFASFFADKHEVELRFPDISSLFQFHGHPIQISQVLINLIKNATEAIEHLEEKWIELKVVFYENTEKLEIRLIDSGNGIPESVREKLFQKQFTTKAPGKGTGLGLTISAKIIADHGGKLYIDDKAKNTTFVIVLPGFKKIIPTSTSTDEIAS